MNSTNDRGADGLAGLPPPPPPSALLPPNGVMSAPVPPPRNPEKSGFAIASLVLPFLGLALPAIVCGHIALHRIKRSKGWLGGRRLAIAGVILGWLGLIGTSYAVMERMAS